MIASTVVVRSYDRYAGERWAAHVVLDDQITSWTCSHGHHSRGPAEKCRTRMQREADALLAAEGLTLTAIEATTPNLWEAAWTEARPASRFGTGGELPPWTALCSRRFVWPHVLIGAEMVPYGPSTLTIAAEERARVR